MFGRSLGVGGYPAWIRNSAEMICESQERSALRFTFPRRGRSTVTRQRGIARDESSFSYCERVVAYAQLEPLRTIEAGVLRELPEWIAWGRRRLAAYAAADRRQRRRVGA